MTAASEHPELASRLRALEGSQAVALWAILFAAALLAYATALGNTHAYDDLALFRRYRELPAGALADLLDPARYNATTGIFTWRPLCFAGHYLVDGALFGYRYAPSLLLNLAIHALNALLLGALARALVARSSGADSDVPFATGAAAALLFAVHPMASEPILCITFRVDLFALTSVLACAWFARRLGEARTRTHLLCGAALLIGLLHKESAAAAVIVAPVAALLFGAPRRAAALLAATLAGVTGAFLLAWAPFRWEGAAPAFLGGGGRALGIANFAVATVEIYLPNIAVPRVGAFATEHHFEAATSLSSVRVLLATGAVITLIGALAAAARRRPLVAFALALGMAGMAPVSQIVAIPDPVAERLAYPMLAAVILLLAPVAGFHMSDGRAVGKALAVVAMLFLGMCTMLRAEEWETPATLNIANLRKANRHALATKLATAGLHLMRAGELQRSGAPQPEIDAAMETAQKALATARRLGPDNAEVWRLDAVRALQQGRPEEALPLAERAAELAPQDPRIRQILDHLRRGS